MPINQNPVYVIDGARTAFLKSRSTWGPFSASDLSVIAGKTLLARQPFAADSLDEVILGCALPSVDEVNIGRIVALRLGCGNKVPGWTVMRNCASGMQALDSAMRNIQLGRSQMVLAGGTDALSRAPLLYSQVAADWFSILAQEKTTLGRLRQFSHIPLSALLTPVIGILKGLTDPMCGLLMGQTAENLAWRFGLSRQQMDEYALESHRRVTNAQASGAFAQEIVPLYIKGKLYPIDDGVRADASIEGLTKLRPFFDRTYGKVTAGNSSQISDGAAWLLLASEEAVTHHKLEPLGRIIDSQWAGLDPAQMGLGPVHAATPILKRHALALEDIAAWEINEAFSAQVLGCLAAWQNEEYCKTELGLSAALGIISSEKLNIHGGAIALGHPVGASGARIVLHLLHVLKKGEQGMAAICIGGGQGGAMLVERC